MARNLAVKKLNCPNCGAVIDIHAEKCAYCGTPYSLIVIDKDIGTDCSHGAILYADDKPIVRQLYNETRKLRAEMNNQRCWSLILKEFGSTAEEASKTFEKFGKEILQ